LILNWGQPERIASDGKGGEILIYSLHSLVTYGGVVNYRYRIFYADSDGKIYNWYCNGGQVPPQQLDITVYMR